MDLDRKTSGPQTSGAETSGPQTSGARTIVTKPSGTKTTAGKPSGRGRSERADVDYDVAIVGGGIAGAAAAIALGKSGFRVALIERSKGLPKHLAGELFHPPGLERLQRLGVYPDLMEAKGQWVEGFAVFRTPDAAPRTLRYAEIPKSSPRGLGIHHSEVVRVLRAHAQRTPGVEMIHGRVSGPVRSGGAVVGVRVRMKGASEETLRARLVVAADGRHSALRTSLGLDGQKDHVGYSVALRVEGALPVPRHGHVILGLPSPTLLYPIGDNEARMLFDVRAPSKSRLPEMVDYVKSDYVSGFSGQLRELADAALAAGEISLAPNTHMTTGTCRVGGAILIGDASGCSHPLTASGMTTALFDAELLAETASRVGVGELCAKAFESEHYRYQRAREMLARALYDTFVGESDGQKLLQNGVFDYWHRSPGGRGHTMSLLSGAASGPELFVQEYLSVAMASLKVAVQDRSRLGGFQGVMTEAAEKLGWLARLVHGNYRPNVVTWKTSLEALSSERRR